MSEKILIVDDSRAIQTIVRRALERGGFNKAEFRSALDGAAAMAIIADWSPDLVITDWHMPGMSGLELLQVLRQTGQDRFAVGFVTTESVPERLAEARAQGAAFILAKPFTDDQICAAAREALQQVFPPNKPPAVVPDEFAAALTVASAATILTQLSRTLKVNINVRVLPDIDLTGLQLPWMLGFYGVDDKPEVRGTCLFDRYALAIIGSLTAAADAASIRQSGHVSAATADNIARMLEDGHSAWFIPSVGHRARLVRSQLLSSVNPKLLEVLAKSSGKCHFRIEVPGHPPGQMIVIAR